MSLLTNKGKLIFLYKGFTCPKKNVKYDILLSPQFYYIKREELPIKSIYKAKKLAPSILEDLLDEDRKYQFEVIKDDNGWFFIAYNPNEIKDYLEEECNIKPHQINRIYFAQQLSKELAKAPLDMDETKALVVINKIVTVVYKNMLETQKYITFSEKLRPKKGFPFKINSANTISLPYSSKDIILVSILMALVGILFLIEGFYYSKNISTLQKRLEKEIEKNPELSSKMIRENILQKYQKIDKRQRKLRETLLALSQLTNKDILLDSLKLTPTQIEAILSIKKGDLEEIKKRAQALHLLVKEGDDKKSLIIKGAL